MLPNDIINLNDIKIREKKSYTNSSSSLMNNPKKIGKKVPNTKSNDNSDDDSDSAEVESD